MEYGIKFRPIKPPSPHLNGKVERSQRTDIEEFYATPDLIVRSIEIATAPSQGVRPCVSCSRLEYIRNKCAALYFRSLAQRVRLRRDATWSAAASADWRGGNAVPLGPVCRKALNPGVQGQSPREGLGYEAQLRDAGRCVCISCWSIW